MPSHRHRYRRRALCRIAALSASLLLALSLALTIGPPVSADELYTIESGDTLSEIADRYGTSVEALQALNNIPSPHDIQIGQIIRIPDSSGQSGSSQSSPAVHAGITTAALAITYTVQAGDTAYGIADQLGVDLQDIRDLNPSINLNLLEIGQQIRVPAPAGSGGSVNVIQQGDPAITEYIVRAGDNLSGIADAHGITLEQLLGHNSGIDRDRIQVGQTIVIPAGTATPADSGESVNTNPSIAQAVPYTVQPGDNASAIAAAHAITLDELRAHNPGVNLDVIQPRQILYVPVPAYNVPALDPSEAGSLVSADYVVRRGDTASGIADLYGISLQELRNLNPFADLNFIRIGQTIKVPWSGGSAYAPGTAPAVTARYRTHTVEAGQTFLGIANAYGLTLDQLREFNSGRRTDLIVIGERLRLGGEIDPPVVATAVVVESADLVQYVAGTYDITPHTLLSNNGWLSADDWVHVGATLRIPHREGLLVTVQAGDTLRGIADAHGVELNRILADSAHGVDDPNMIVIGQEIIVPLAVPEFGWPTNSLLELTDPFGLCRNWDCSYRHRGLDMAIDAWEPILAAADGLVTFVGGDPASGLGWYIEIEHPNGWRTVYAHLSDFAVYQGQLVKRGEVIGYNGTTGESTGPHLHFEVRHNEWYVDPMAILPPL